MLWNLLIGQDFCLNLLDIYLLFFSVIDSKIIREKLLDPFNIRKKLSLHIHKWLTIVIISLYKNYKLAVFQVLITSLKCFNYSENINVMSLESRLGSNYFWRKKKYWIQLKSFRDKLEKNNTYNVSKNDYLNTNIVFQIQTIINKSFNKR